MAVYLNTVSAAEHYFVSVVGPVSRDRLNFVLICCFPSGECHDAN